MTEAVRASLSHERPARDLAAGFEEEGVSLGIEIRGGADVLARAREAARHSPAGIGLASDGEALVAVLAASPARPYLTAPISQARPFAHAVARVVARRPIAAGAWGPDGG